MKLLFIGDSITDSTRANREDPHSTGRGYVFLLESELTAQGEAYEVLNCGVSGNRVVDLLARIKKDCINLQPDVITVLVGVNDVAHELYHQNGVGPALFEEVYRILLREMKAALPKVKFILMAPYLLHGSLSDPYFEDFAQGVAEYGKIACRLAREFDAEFIDLQREFDLALEKASTEHWSKDGVHPTPAGHTVIAAAWKQAFTAWLRKEE